MPDSIDWSIPLDAAITGARDALKREQRSDGSWEGATDAGPGASAIYWIVERALGTPDPAELAEGARYLLSEQQADGSFQPFPGAGEGTAAATALCRAGLLACGVSAAHPALGRALEFIDAHGGMRAVGAAFRLRGDPTPLFLLAAGAIGPEFLPGIPGELVLTPFERLFDRRVHSGNVMVFMVLCAFIARYGAPSPRGLIGKAARKAEQLRIQRYLFEWQNETGDWNGQASMTALILLGLGATGLTRSDPRIARGLAWLRALLRPTARGLRSNAMTTDVWSTALATLALDAAGEPFDGDALSAARRHLLAAQAQRPMPRVNQRKPNAVRTGAWPFQRGNEVLPDCDDTGLVLAALGTSAGPRAPRAVFAATEAAMRWLRDMQNPDGGFAAYVWNLPSKRPGPMFLTDIDFSLDRPARALAFLFDPPAELSDPASEGVTGRVLWGLGACGVRRDDPAVCRAIAFLRAQQCANGAWWGRWMTCYLAETATTLLGLAAVGEDMQSAYVESAARFLTLSQNPDGGFGESHAAYRDPASAGLGPSAPTVTGLVLSALLAARPGVDAVTLGAARYLIAVQAADGTWDNAGWLHTILPPDGFYTYDVPAKTLPLFALGRLRARLRGEA